MANEPAPVTRTGIVGIIARFVFGAPAPGAMPPRVARGIERQQRESEVLIGWVQLLIVLVFAVLYFVSPKTFDDGVGFEPVPMALGVYFAFTLARLIAAYYAHLPNWMLTLSVIADMALLIALIWSFHLQYQQPLAMFLKAPTMLYVFIFIALRALRFDSRFVILAGCVAAAGWGVLVLLAVGSGEMAIEDPITRDYVTYMTTAKVLLGAELDRILTILVVTGVLTLALVRARRFFLRAMLEGQAVRDLSRFFSPEIAEHIIRSNTRMRAGMGEVRTAAVLNCDIRGFTRMAKAIPPTEAMAILAEYEHRLVPVIQANHGTIDKFLGDGIMATFGAAIPSETYAADAVRAIDALVAESDAWNAERVAAGKPPIVVNFAVASGDVIFGAVGSGDRLELTVIGDAVNRSAKLEKSNKQLGSAALTERETYERALAQGLAPRSDAAAAKANVSDGREQIDAVILAMPQASSALSPSPSADIAETSG